MIITYNTQNEAVITVHLGRGLKWQRINRGQGMFYSISSRTRQLALEDSSKEALAA